MKEKIVRSVQASSNVIHKEETNFIKIGPEVAYRFLHFIMLIVSQVLSL
jgi:hypothetical protein